MLRNRSTMPRPVGMPMRGLLRSRRKGRLYQRRRVDARYALGTPEESTMIDLQYWPTPNGKKATILLEECGMPYRVVPFSIGQGDQFKPAFLAISPNNRMPAIVDDKPDDGGPPPAPFRVGGALMY